MCIKESEKNFLQLWINKDEAGKVLFSQAGMVVDNPVDCVDRL